MLDFRELPVGAFAVDLEASQLIPAFPCEPIGAFDARANFCNRPSRALFLGRTTCKLRSGLAYLVIQARAFGHGALAVGVDP